jgi:hypothetical protein
VCDVSGCAQSIRQRESSGSQPTADARKRVASEIDGASAPGMVRTAALTKRDRPSD